MIKGSGNRILKLSAAIVMLAILALACGSETPTAEPSAADSGVQDAGGDQPALTATSSPPTESANPNLLRPGTYIVSTDIQPGFYRGQAGLGFLDSCYWERLENLSGEFEAILANDNSVGQFYIEVEETDFALSTDCAVEHLPTLPGPTSDFPTAITAGTYLVGIDIQPGTYQGQAGEDITESCYWERVTNVKGGFEGIIANDNANGQYYVQITASDFAFSTDCEMTRIGD